MRFAADRPLRLAPATASDYRELARRRIPRQLFDYVDGGAYDEATLRSNVDDLGKVLLRQVVMRDVSTREQSVEVLGQRLKMPVILAPVGLGGMLARRAEVQAARAAEKAGVPFVESTVSICPIEEVAKATSAPPWFQLYVMRDRSYAEDLMARAAARGAPGLIVGPDGGGGGGRGLAGPDLDHRRGGGRRSPPRHPKRAGRPTRAMGERAPRPRPGLSSALGEERGPRRAAPHLREPRERGPRGPLTGRVQGV